MSETPNESNASFPPKGGAAPAPGSRELVLLKNGRRFVFRCAPGEEQDLLRRLNEMVRDPEVDLSWFDAAVLSHQVGQRLGRQMNELGKLK